MFTMVQMMMQHWHSTIDMPADYYLFVVAFAVQMLEPDIALQIEAHVDHGGRVCKCQMCTCTFSHFLRRLSFVLDCINLDNYPGLCSLCVVPQTYVSEQTLIADDVVMIKFMIYPNGCELTSTHLGWIEEDNTFTRYNHQEYHGPPPLINVNVLYEECQCGPIAVLILLRKIIHKWGQYSMHQTKARGVRARKSGSRKRRV